MGKVLRSAKQTLKFITTTTTTMIIGDGVLIPQFFGLYLARLVVETKMMLMLMRKREQGIERANKGERARKLRQILVRNLNLKLPLLLSWPVCWFCSTQWSINQLFSFLSASKFFPSNLSTSTPLHLPLPISLPTCSWLTRSSLECQSCIASTHCCCCCRSISMRWK